MIDEVVNSILAAEAKAEEISHSASEKAASILKEGEERAGRIKAEAEEQSRQQTAEFLASHAALAEENYASAVEEGKKKAENEYRFDGRAEKAAEDIARYILSGDC